MHQETAPFTLPKCDGIKQNQNAAEQNHQTDKNSRKQVVNVAALKVIIPKIIKATPIQRNRRQWLA